MSGSCSEKKRMVETMISDDERREVAARLRNGGVARNSEEAYVLLLWCVGIRPQLPATSTYEDAMVRLADLIDRPTCQNKQVVYNRTAPKEFRTDNFTCSACGETFCADGDGVNHPIDWAFCPNCGAEVKDDAEPNLKED